MAGKEKGKERGICKKGKGKGDNGRNRGEK